MKTHQAWILALTNVVAIAIGQAMAQSPIPMAAQTYAPFSQGRPIVQQASDERYMKFEKEAQRKYKEAMGYYKGKEYVN